jgi:hypothetical protein
LVLLTFQPVFFCLNANSNLFMIQDDTLFINETNDVPVFDGIGNDNCWKNALWQTIDQVWIPWGTTMDPSDFSGRYKVLWSAQENLLYFLLEITDDVVSDAYVPGQTAAIFNFDMFEVFIDENKSGGYHVFDGTADDEASLGVNAENAFAYHIFPNPMHNLTTIEFSLIKPSDTEIGIFDLSGRKLVSIPCNNFNAGTHSVIWDCHNNQGNRLNASIYQCRIISSDAIQYQQLVIY